MNFSEVNRQFLTVLKVIETISALFLIIFILVNIFDVLSQVSETGFANIAFFIRAVTIFDVFLKMLFRWVIVNAIRAKLPNADYVGHVFLVAMLYVFFRIWRPL